MSALSTHKTYGWTAQPRDVSAFLGDKKDLKAPEPQTVDNILIPDTPLAKAVLDYARKELSEETFNHSMRVYYYGIPFISQKDKCPLLTAALTSRQSDASIPPPYAPSPRLQ